MLRQITISLFVWSTLLYPTSMSPGPSDPERCSYWQAKIVTRRDDEPIHVDVDKLTEQQTLTAIECLLKLKGNRRKASFGGALEPTVSGMIPDTPVEVAALFYISYLFEKNWHHADATTIRSRSTGKYNQPEDVAAAYKSYRKWFKEVKRIGLAKAREQKLRPLPNEKVRWY